jgi:O-acetyl-ADP-ribose deacetylase (regulator of RNase III)
MTSARRKAPNEWTHPSVSALATSTDPVSWMIEEAKSVAFRAMESGWSGPPFDPLSLADFLGIHLVASDDVRDARTLPSGGQKLKIEYNPNRPKARIHFSIAHELAHTFFPDCRAQIRNRVAHDQMRGDDWQLEMLCNIGASELLMPVGSIPELKDDVPSIDDALALREKYAVSVEAVLLRLHKLTRHRYAIFAASRREAEPSLGRYQIDYALVPHEWPLPLPTGELLPEQSVVTQCTAIGFTAKGNETWTDDVDPVHVECVGVSPYPNHSYPRVLGILTIKQRKSEPRNTIVYLRGDASEPQVSGKRIIAHVVNDKTPRWGAGFARAVSKKWPLVQNDFIEWCESYKSQFKLGNTHFTIIDDSTAVCHMIAQHGYATSKPGIRYLALENCLEELATNAIERNATVHMPRIGCGQAGGRWEIVSELIDSALCRKGIEVTVYDLPLSNAERKKSAQASLFA